MTPSGNPGKFSTSVVNMSWPPGWSLVELGSPSISRGSRLARAVYTAAVSPAGPDPMMMTLRLSLTSLLVPVVLGDRSLRSARAQRDPGALSSRRRGRRVPPGPQHDPGQQEDRPEQEIGGPHLLGEPDVDQPD